MDIAAFALDTHPDEDRKLVPVKAIFGYGSRMFDEPDQYLAGDSQRAGLFRSAFSSNESTQLGGFLLFE